jgi:hypothetical protein
MNFPGGFIITSAAAALSKEGINCHGLVLFNSAGKIIDGAGLTPNEEPLFKTYEGPRSSILRAFGTFFISVLRPSVKRTVSTIVSSTIQSIIP